MERGVKPDSTSREWRAKGAEGDGLPSGIGAGVRVPPFGLMAPGVFAVMAPLWGNEMAGSNRSLDWALL